MCCTHISREGLFDLGFSWVEIGSVTPKPQVCTFLLATIIFLLSWATLCIFRPSTLPIYNHTTFGPFWSSEPNISLTMVIFHISVWQSFPSCIQATGRFRAHQSLWFPFTWAYCPSQSPSCSSPHFHQPRCRRNKYTRVTVPAQITRYQSWEKQD